MTMDDFAAFEQIAHQVAPGGRLLRAWPLTGGVSARVTALEIARADGQTQKLVVRQYGDVNLRLDPNVAAHEFRLLQTVRAAGIPAPMPYHYDESGAIFPTPYLVVQYVEGQTDFAPSNLPDVAAQLAVMLARIHTVDARAQTFLPKRVETLATRLQDRPAEPDESVSEGRIRDVLGAVWPLPERNPVGLLHGDYWPGNILWHDGQIAAVIDWEDPALGDPLSDVATARLDLLWAFGADAMHAFTETYQEITPYDFTDLPYWDLYAALRPIGKFLLWAGDADAAERMMERHRFFAEQAFEHLSETSLRPHRRS